MKLMVLPKARWQQVEAVVRDVLGHSGGTEDLTPTIVRMSTSNDWTIHCAGISDPVLQASFCDVIRDALRRADTLRGFPRPRARSR
jgi:hypothetical protein